MADAPSVGLEAEIERRFVEGARFTAEYHMGGSKVHRALERLAARLSSLNVPYAIVGALALNAYGYLRATVDIDVLLTKQGLERLKEECLGRGYVEKFPGSRGLRDVEHQVDIDVVLAGEYPGDGLEKPVAFPDPAACAIRGESYSLVPLPVLIELKIASGLTAPHRLRDLADVIELIRANTLSRRFDRELSPYVRDKYVELWQASRTSTSPGP